jgi:hypothetical protein
MIFSKVIDNINKFLLLDFVGGEGQQEEEDEDNEELNPKLRSPVHQFLHKNLKVKLAVTTGNIWKHSCNSRRIL